MSARTVVFKRAIAEAFRGNLDVVNDDMRAVALTADYVADDAAHDFLDDVSAAYRIGTPVAVTMTVSDDAEVGSDSPEITDPADGDEVFQLLVYRHNASEASALLLCCYAAFREAPKVSNGAAMTLNLPAVLFRFGS